MSGHHCDLIANGFVYRAAEFSHTVIHKAGVGLSKGPLPSGAAAAAAAAGRPSPLVSHSFMSLDLSSKHTRPPHTLHSL